MCVFIHTVQVCVCVFNSTVLRVVVKCVGSMFQHSTVFLSTILRKVYMYTLAKLQTHTHTNTMTLTHTYTYEVVFGESDIWQRNWGHELYPTFTVCIHTMSPETLQ